MRAVVLGEALIDVFGGAGDPAREEAGAPERVVGGAPLNLAAHLAAHGWDVALVTRVGRDEDGLRVLSTLEHLGVDRSLVEVDDEVPTGTVTVEMGPGGHAFTINAPAAWDHLDGPDRLPAHDALVWGSLASRGPNTRSTIARLVQASAAALKVFDVNLRQPHVHPAAVREGLDAARLVKLNEDELAAVAEHLGIRAEPADYFSASPALEWLCVTMGERGAALHHRSGRAWSVPPERVAVVDTVGAGDAFLAGLIDGLGRGLGEEAAMREGASTAAAVLTRRGGLPSRP